MKRAETAEKKLKAAPTPQRAEATRADIHNIVLALDAYVGGDLKQAVIILNTLKDKYPWPSVDAPSDDPPETSRDPSSA